MITTVKQGDIWRDIHTGGKYQIVQVEKELDGSILNVKMRNINSGTMFDLGEWELLNAYTKIDSLNKSKQRG